MATLRSLVIGRIGRRLAYGFEVVLDVLFKEDVLDVLWGRTVTRGKSP
jgi:hypothetical protein